LLALERKYPAVICAFGRQDLRGRRLGSGIAAALVAVATLAMFAFNEHAPYNIQAGLVARIVAGLVPFLAATTAAAAVLRPRLGFLAILLLTPIFDLAQVSRTVGSFQVIAQTVFVVALGIGLLLRLGEARLRPIAGLRGVEPRQTTGGATYVASAEAVKAAAAVFTVPMSWRSRFSLTRVAAGATIALLALAAVSTAFSPDVPTSATVLVHGILEPAAMAAVLLALRPTRRYLALVALALALSVAIGGLLDMVQTLATVRSLSVLQAQRLLFSRVTFFNVGLFGEMLAMAVPLLLAALLASRLLHLRRAAVALLAVATLIALASLFLTFSKSAYLSTAGGTLVLLLLVARTWRHRAAIVLAVALLSTVVIPWPALVLQVAPPIDQAYRNVMVSIVGESRYDSWNPSTVSGRGSLLERWYATEAAVHMAIDHPILGIGLDQFLTQYVDHYRPPEAELALDSAHSMWAEVAAELGIPVLILVLLVYAAAMLALWRVYRSPPDGFTRLLVAALLASMVAWLMVATVFAGDMYRPWRNMASDYVMMMVLVASAFALYRLARRDQSTDPAANGSARAAEVATAEAASA
jgi:O-antigen ligase